MVKPRERSKTKTIAMPSTPEQQTDDLPAYVMEIRDIMRSKNTKRVNDTYRDTIVLDDVPKMNQLLMWS